MDNFRFAPELFECRAEAIAFLAENNIDWFTDFTSIETVHDIYGLEVEGVSNKETAQKIMKLLDSYFGGALDDGFFREDGWRHHRMFEDERGWAVEINRYPHPPVESWLENDHGI